MMGRSGLLAWRNASFTLAMFVAVLGTYQILQARTNCDIEACRGPMADPWLWLEMAFGAAWLVLSAACVAAGLLVHARIRRRFPESFSPGSRWVGTRNLAGFLAVFAFLGALVQWDSTGDRWAPSQCDHDGTPIEECPDYGYHGDQVRSLWFAGTYLALGVAAAVVAAYAHHRARRLTPLPPTASPDGPRDDLVGRRLLFASLGSIALAGACFAVGRFDRVAFAYAGVALAAVAVGSGLACLIWPRSSIGAKWSSVLLIAAGAFVGFLNYAIIIWSTLE